MNKLKPNIKLGCSKCDKSYLDEITIKDNFNIKFNAKKVSLINSNKNKSSKIISLF